MEFDIVSGENNPGNDATGTDEAQRQDADESAPPIHQRTFEDPDQN